jgi:hypothetical protein
MGRYGALAKEVLRMVEEMKLRNMKPWESSKPWTALCKQYYDRTKLKRAEYATKPHTVGTWAESVQVENEA